MKSFPFVVFCLVAAALFIRCSSTQKLQSKAPLSLGKAYCQDWIAGTQGGGSGINIFIPVVKEVPKGIQLDSVYFRGKGTTLEFIQDENALYVGRFISKFNQKPDMVMSRDPREEYFNEIPQVTAKIPFELKDSECVITYKENNLVKYFKIENISEKATLNYPSAPVKGH